MNTDASFYIVGRQVLILFVMILTGFVCAKKHFFSDESIRSITKFILYVVTPCVIVKSFHREFDAAMLKGLGIALAAAVGAHVLNMVFAHSLIHDKEDERRRVLIFGTVFSNCGYMALPLQQALLGNDGVFYGAAYIAVFNILNWTYGLVLMGGKDTKISLKQVIINPGIIGVALGFLFFLTPIKLPSELLVPVESFASLNTPLPMLVIGYYLAGISSFSVLKDIKLTITIIIRLIIAPFATLGILYFCGLHGTILAAMIIAAASPSGANTVMFSVMFKRDAQLAVTLVAMSTLFSILSMPLIVALTQ